MIMSEVKVYFWFLFISVSLSQVNCFQIEHFLEANSSSHTFGDNINFSLINLTKCLHDSNNPDCLKHLSAVSSKRIVRVRRDVDVEGNQSSATEPILESHDYSDTDEAKVPERRVNPYLPSMHSYYRGNERKNIYSDHIQFPQRPTPNPGSRYKFDTWHTYNPNYKYAQNQRLKTGPYGRHSSTTKYPPKPSLYQNQHYTTKSYYTVRQKQHSFPGYNEPSLVRYTTRRPNTYSPTRYTKPTSYQPKVTTKSPSRYTQKSTMFTYSDYFDDTYATSPEYVSSPNSHPKFDHSAPSEYVESQTQMSNSAYTTAYTSQMETEEVYEASIEKINYGCICVPYYQCDDGKIITDGAGLLNPRIGKTSYKETQIEETYSPPGCGPYHVCCSQPETQTQKPYINRCGIRNPGGLNARILTSVSKGESEFGEWPWQVAIVEKNQTLTFICGGVLIDDYYVLTVAHCVYDYQEDSYNRLLIRLGEWDTFGNQEYYPHQDYQPSWIKVHPYYNSENLYNDIAIIRLVQKVEYQPNIATVCLPYEEENYEQRNCVTTGWGKDAYNGQYSNVLKEVSLQTLTNNKCENVLRKTRLGKYFKLHDHFMCAGGQKNVDACEGDGGGPLVCYREDGTYTLVGLVSWGIECGQENIPGVYVKVQKYLEWIKESTTQ